MDDRADFTSLRPARKTELTATMAGEPERSEASKRDPGLVLVYAPDLEAVPTVVPIGQGSTLLGREPPFGGLPLKLPSISRVHARVTRTGDACTITDVGSRNGVFVRGRQTQTVELAPGDDVRIGDALYVFVADGAGLHSGTRADGSDDPPYPYAPVACGPATRKIYDELVPIAAVDLPVLVHGETGTGKELVAQAVHAASGRRGSLCAINCAAIPAQLVESELFGFKKGAFTGADRDSLGVVRAAHGGTLFLDEIGDLSLEIQPKLLRLLESYEITPVGSTRAERVDVRVVCATHADLESLVKQHRFRGDLLARIRGHVVVLPPLRNRKEDLLRLVHMLLGRLGRADVNLTVNFMAALTRHHWPYNVRELYTVLRRAVALIGEGEALSARHLPDDVSSRASERPPASASAAAPPARRETPRPPIPTPDDLRTALAAHGGNVAALSRMFQRDRSLIHRWLKQNAIEPEQYRR